LYLLAVSGGPFVKPVLPFDLHFRPPTDARLKLLAQLYRLKAIAGAGDDFSRARKLKTWVRKQWNHGFDQIPSPYDAIDLLAAARTGLSFQCGHYTQVFVECCLAIGIPARVIGLARKEVAFPHKHSGNSGHVVAEAYCRELAKWVVFDCDSNCIFVDNNDEPLGALEIHEAWHAKRADAVKRLQDDPQFTHPQPTPEISQREITRIMRDIERHQTKQFYYYIHTGTAQGYQGKGLARFKPKCVRFTGCAQHPPAMGFKQNDGELGSGGFLTAQREHWEWPINQTYARATMLGENPSRTVRIDLANTMPFFDHYDLRLNGRKLRKGVKDDVTIELRFGRSEFLAAAVDVMGRPATPARLILELQMIK
jgi:hypothetical protein